MRLAVYTDYAYGRADGAVFAERAFVRFLEGVASHVDAMVLIGRLNPELGQSHYRVDDAIDFRPLPFYPSLAQPVEAIGAMARSLGRFWNAIDDVDCVWLLGPHPLELLFAALAVARGKRVTLGVRQDLPAYSRARHPERSGFHRIADLLDWSWRLLARRCRTVVVGPELAKRYAAARELLPIAVSLVRDSDLVDPDAAARRDWSGERQVLSVGRLEAEKNPLLLADILAALVADDQRWRLVVCGEGPLAADLAARLEELGVAEHAELAGYMPIDGGLGDLYRQSQALLHVSWTEGMPQVLLEAFAAGTPIVGTAVGGVPGAVGDDALLVPPGDVTAPVEALRRLAAEPELRERLVRGGIERVRRQTLDAESKRVADFLGDGLA
ncbi:MAG TPA: glycosyltransferase [Thermoleophilaceae bacterium]|nr:glycosyltransferase [Thermoleophilaceae bacterium]